MTDEKNSVDTGTILMAFLAGAAVGTGLALLYAPKTGKELRDRISDMTDDAVDKIKTYVTEAQDKIKTTLDEGKELLKEKKSVLSSALEAGKEAMEREKETMET
ncbi:YtxH domain-containing protein [Geobacter sp. DSM 9736]|uniref:YtxH domain-containing protein n=1 Tax=Geobacter sp. DSM 9736 TaxID=1277350 RepID=UPI000B5029A7|nr:YtxH domain-containing protein [Geobacter sp. DSM 9736]SNB48037.1 Gas vesicle protein [Geobacter sp. DSM 9736]